MGEYGYCEETGEPIGVKRLDARPIATLSLEAQERHERKNARSATINSADCSATWARPTLPVAERGWVCPV